MKRTYIFNPVGVDSYDRRPYQPTPGTAVQKVQPYGCPPNGTAGHCFVAPVGNPKAFSLVLLASLTPQRKV